jgi:hypothetical protein
VQQFFDADYPDGGRYYWKSQYLRDLSDEAIDRLIELNHDCPSHHSTIDIWQMGGALSRIAPDATAFGDRSAPFLIGIESNWHEAEEDQANIDWNRKVYTTMDAFATGAEYMNFPGFYEDKGKIRQSYGENYARLVELKKKYDPKNLFRLNQNIAPGG